MFSYWVTDNFSYFSYFLPAFLTPLGNKIRTRVQIFQGIITSKKFQTGRCLDDGKILTPRARGFSKQSRSLAGRNRIEKNSPAVCTYLFLFLVDLVRRFVTLGRRSRRGIIERNFDARTLTISRRQAGWEILGAFPLQPTASAIIAAYFT